MGTTDDRNDPRLTHGVDDVPVPQAEVYLVLSEEERHKGFVRPLRFSYRHVGRPGPKHGLRDLTEEEQERYLDYGYAQYEEYPEDPESSALGRFWSQGDLDNIDRGCNTTTTMASAIAESYARTPAMYGATYCVNCSKHRPVGEQGEFIWDDGSRVGT